MWHGTVQLPIPAPYPSQSKPGPSSPTNTSLAENILPFSHYQILLILQGLSQVSPPIGSLPRCLPTIPSMVNFYWALTVYKAQFKHLRCMNSLTSHIDPNRWVGNLGSFHLTSQLTSKSGLWFCEILSDFVHGRVFLWAELGISNIFSHSPYPRCKRSHLCVHKGNEIALCLAHYLTTIC